MASWEFSPSTIRLYRPDGIFGDSIISALFSNVTIAVLALGATRLKAPVRIIVILLCMVAGVVTGARTFYYLLVIVGAYLMLAKTRDVSLEKKALLLCLMIAVVAVVASPLGQSMIDSLTFQDIVSSRDIKRQLAIEQFGNSPVFGIGTLVSTLFTRLRLACRPTPVFTGTNPHNVYVQVLCENGLVGFIPFVLGLICSLWLAFKRKNALAVVLLVIYTAIGWSLGILYSIAFTSFFVVFVCSLLGTSED
ncbi:MAG: O-antigen ligase family protein [Gordonibacter pamelaeae]